MIRLVRLRVDGFKQLRGVDLAFPGRCCVLVEGLNEAGKSTLFEAIFTALYGRGLALLGRGVGQTESMIGNGINVATIELEIDCGEARLTIERRFRRGRVQDAQLTIRHADASIEVVRGANAVNAEILARMNGLDGEALLASCFVRQKKLGQLEEVGRAERQTILLKLLDLDRLTWLKQQFPWSAREEAGLDQARQRRRLVELVERRQEATEALAALERRLHLVDVLAALGEAARLTGERDRWRDVAQDRRAAHDAASALLRRAEALGEIADLLRQILAARGTVLQRQSDLSQVRGELAALARLEERELPRLESESADMAQLAGQLARITEDETADAEMAQRRERLTLGLTALESAAGKMAEAARLQQVLQELASRRTILEAEIGEIARLDNACRLLSHLLDARQERDRRTEDLRKIDAQWLALDLEEDNRLPQLESRTAALATLDERLAVVLADEHDLEEMVARRARIQGWIDRYDDLAQRRAEQGARLERIASARARVAEAERLDRCARQVTALRNWSEVTSRSEEGRRAIEELDRAEALEREALALQQDAEGNVRSRTVITGVGGAVVALGLVGVASFRSFLPVMLLALIFALVGIVLVAWGWRQRLAAVRSRDGARSAAAARQLEVRERRLRQKVYADQPTPDVASAAARLRQLQVEVPAHPDEGTARATELARQLPEGWTVDGCASSLEAELSAQRAAEHESSVADAELILADRQLVDDLSREGLEQIADARELVAQLAEVITDGTAKLDRARESLAGHLQQLDLPHDQSAARSAIDRQIALLDNERTLLLQRLAERPQLDRERTQLREEIQRRSASLEAERQALADLGIFLSEDDIIEECATARLATLRAARGTFDLAEREREREQLIAEVAGTRAAIQRANEERDRLIADATRLVHDAGLPSDLAPDAAAIGVAVASIDGSRAELADRLASTWEAIAADLERFHLPRHSTEARQQIGNKRSALAQRIDGHREQLKARPRVESTIDRLQNELAELERSIEEKCRALAQACPDAGLEPPDEERGEEPLLAMVVGQHAQYDTAALTRERSAAQSEAVEAMASARQADRSRLDQQATAAQILTSLGAPMQGEVVYGQVVAAFPEVATLTVASRVALTEQRDGVVGQLQSIADERARLEGELRVDAAMLDPGDCAEQVATFERRKAICQQAAPVIDRVRDNILQAVLPGTIEYMRQMLPLLTAGRYHDAELDDTTYRLRVWDAQRRGYVDKEIYSGGTQDQFSLALRLGFALAALPQERGARPGFIFLDEPTAGFDSQRRAAFVDLLTRGELAERFDQIFLASPEGVFADNSFPQRLQLAGGRIVGTSLTT